MASTFQVKVDYDGQIRRFNLPTATDFATLRATLTGLYGAPPGAEHFTIAYYDNEADFVLIGSDVELQEAVAIMVLPDQPLRLILGVPGVATQRPAPPKQPAPAQAQDARAAGSASTAAPTAARAADSMTAPTAAPRGPGHRGPGHRGRGRGCGPDGRGRRGGPGGPWGHGATGGPWGPGGPWGAPGGMPFAHAPDWPPAPGPWGAPGMWGAPAYGAPPPHPPPMAHGGPGDFFRMFGLPFMPGPLLHKLRRMANEMPPELRDACMTFMSGMGESGEMPQLAALAPSLFSILQEFANGISNAEDDLSPDSVEVLTSSVRASLDGSVSTTNADNLIQVITTALQMKQVRKILKWVARNCESAYAFADDSDQPPVQSAEAEIQARSWESVPHYDGLPVPPAPLFLGDSGPRVVHLHAALIHVGVITAQLLGGDRVRTFGQHTSEALKMFQRDHGLTEMVEPGGYDATTRASLLSLLEDSGGQTATAAGSAPDEGQATGTAV